ncbi:hypothetical protein T310_8751, partial [Rasamsonia emersonii CBS 393.64]
ADCRPASSGWPAAGLLICSRATLSLHEFWILKLKLEACEDWRQLRHDGCSCWRSCNTAKLCFRHTIRRIAARLGRNPPLHAEKSQACQGLRT